jgi:nucleotide-binding universal stress UspA family protein
MMIKHLLVPVDFSEVSENAIRVAANFAAETDAKVTLLHSYLIPGYSGGMAYETFIPPIDEHLELINKQLDEFAEGLPELNELRVEKIAIPGSVQDMIGSYVQDNDVDLVITGTKGASGFMGFLLGTESERIEAEVKCPVVLVPENTTVKKGIRIAFAHDYKSTISQQQRKILQFFLDFYDGTLDVVHVEEKHDLPEAERSVIDNLKDLRPNFHKVVNDDVEKGLNDFIEKNNVDMLALIYHDHGFLNRIFGRSTTRNLTYHTKIPLLVLK